MIDRGESPEERSRRVLRERARELARPMGEESVGEAIELTTFRIGGELHALESRHVRGVVPGGPFALLPGAAEYILGAANVRGDVALVVDIRPLLGLRGEQAAAGEQWIVLGDAASELAIVVESLEEMIAVPSDRLESPSWLHDSKASSRTWLRGVTEDGSVVLDAPAILADRRLFLSQSSTASDGEME